MTRDLAPEPTIQTKGTASSGANAHRTGMDQFGDVRTPSAVPVAKGRNPIVRKQRSDSAMSGTGLFRKRTGVQAGRCMH